MTLETLNDYIFNLSVFIILFIDDVTNRFIILNQCRKTSPANAVQTMPHAQLIEIPNFYNTLGLLRLSQYN